jgi:hypothetical protein
MSRVQCLRAPGQNEMRMPHRPEESDRNLHGMRYRGGMGLNPGLDGTARSSGFDMGNAGQNMARQHSGGAASDQFQMPGSMPDGVPVS